MDKIRKNKLKKKNRNNNILIIILLFLIITNIVILINSNNGTTISILVGTTATSLFGLLISLGIGTGIENDLKNIRKKLNEKRTSFKSKLLYKSIMNDDDISKIVYIYNTIPNGTRNKTFSTGLIIPHIMKSDDKKYKEELEEILEDYIKV